MSKPETITIDDVKYVRADSIPMKPAVEGPIKIIVVDRGFVYIGQVVSEDEQFVTLANASNIRRWGTSKGLGELVGGPKNNTVLDKTGSLRIPMRAVISMIDVEQEKWTSKL